LLTFSNVDIASESLAFSNNVSRGFSVSGNCAYQFSLALDGERLAGMRST
jgi:hypothetical protein